MEYEYNEKANSLLREKYWTHEYLSSLPAQSDRASTSDVCCVNDKGSNPAATRYFLSELFLYQLALFFGLLGFRTVRDEKWNGYTPLNQEGSQ